MIHSLLHVQQRTAKLYIIIAKTIDLLASVTEAIKSMMKPTMLNVLVAL